MIIWAGAVICSFLAERVYIPGAVGMICSGLFLRNVATGILIRGLKASWSKQIRAAALSIIFLRSGLEIELGVSSAHEHAAASWQQGPKSSCLNAQALTCPLIYNAK